MMSLSHNTENMIYLPPFVQFGYGMDVPYTLSVWVWVSFFGNLERNPGKTEFAEFFSFRVKLRLLGPALQRST